MTYTASAPEGTPDQAQALVCVATLALAGVVAGATPWVGAPTKATDCMAREEEEGRRALLV